MKIFDMLVEKSLIASKKVVNAIDAINELSHQLQLLALNVHRLAIAVHRHEVLLRQLMQSNMLMMQDVQEVSTDFSLPNVVPTKTDKPN